MNTKIEQKGTIKLSDSIKEELKTFGTMGETFEDVIKRLMFIAKNGKVADKEAKTNKEIGRSI